MTFVLLVGAAVLLPEGLCAQWKTPWSYEGARGATINPAGMLPHGAAYYIYMGSLTAPPCTEGVTWFVLKTAVDISAEEINAFAKLYHHDVRPRPLQPLNGRVVKESQ